jgi:hypothetical protein
VLPMKAASISGGVRPTACICWLLLWCRDMATSFPVRATRLALGACDRLRASDAAMGSGKICGQLGSQQRGVIGTIASGISDCRVSASVNVVHRWRQVTLVVREPQNT